MTEKEFRSLLRALPGSYEDFVNFISKKFPDDEGRRLVSELIANTPDADTQTVMVFYLEQYGYVCGEDGHWYVPDDDE